jgi:hypothetical protein
MFEPRAIALIVGFLILLAFVSFLVYLVVTQWNDPGVHQFVTDHFRVIVCLPSAGLFAFVIVAIFQVSAGQIQFSAFGFQFSGAAGPVIMWILAFLAIGMMIKALW